MLTATDKTTQQGGNGKFLYGVSEMQGWRISKHESYSLYFPDGPCSPDEVLMLRAAMEDAHTAILNLDGASSEAETNTFFAVYDGHGGTSDSTFHRWSLLISAMIQAPPSQSTQGRTYITVFSGTRHTSSTITHSR